MSELKPCPFCGQAATPIVDYNRHLVWCNNVNCVVMPSTSSFTSAADAAGKWNRRAAPEGYVLVPREPTEEMIVAYAKGTGAVGISSTWERAIRAGYKEMIAAAEGKK